MMDNTISERDRAEIERSAEEARMIVLDGADRSQIDRYLSPPSDTPYPLEYAFYLLGDIRGKTVVDLGCGTGENILPLVDRRARVIGIDISPDLLELARQRLQNAHREATLKIGSAYDTGLDPGSVDAIFCIALVHHLDIGRVRDEMLRILTKNGVVVLKEPIRLSKTYGFLRSLLPARENISEFEHPLTREELATITEHFEAQETRYFRLPWLPLVARVLPFLRVAAWKADRWLLRQFPAVQRYATSLATRLVKTDN
jgi:SAM-dependent methyltransferase